MSLLMFAFFAWLFLCPVIGRLAEKDGRDYGTYFMASLFLSPVVGFIVLTIMGDQAAVRQQMAIELLQEGRA